ncbi:MAG TPA: hypothetical protein ACFYD2_02620 [Candidatus Avalokitesvara rifleensis]|uniref:hypothetical protein n=1 Tax=Candidatus Avalokitesvara rifleensis TaxID=3367620 RepID=UPI0027140F76|nr:hypothetical protein [Candidatus Brocadiales bacterium]
MTVEASIAYKRSKMLDGTLKRNFALTSDEERKKEAKVEKVDKVEAKAVEKEKEKRITVPLEHLTQGKAPPITTYLLLGEKVLNSCQADDSTYYYATDRRIIKYKSEAYPGDSSAFSDISYKEITAISLVKEHFYVGVLVAGVVLAVIGIVVVMGERSGTPTFHALSLMFPIELKTLGFLSFALGAALIGSSFSKRKAYYWLKGPGLLRDEEEQGLWLMKVSKENWNELEGFAKTIRENIPRVLE